MSETVTRVVCGH